MTIPPIDPSMVLGAESTIQPISTPPVELDGGQLVDPAGASAFGNVLSNAIGGLERTQQAAADGAAALASGTAENVESVVMAAEKAKLAMQMASTLRTKGVEALTTVLHTQI
ncbi:flagellar hook-basal body complex protein FliE [Patulibacter brassicae]|jgi:flagellar hook-basal body complex protein FliE|uniref:Flagellar hook-basal body complex protein FliE n=1 Tax=Patulibacter brassicae TaxID=1705717 RepID=A0ABU4VQK9_9ACTN|nr:flagellar hook-basal body complex protein FliE [Patulibacter brassicae]MDX8153211.1 flagellar hook-basal body complex protein FliE [Patulibacter brassicae]